VDSKLDREIDKIDEVDGKVQTQNTVLERTQISLLIVKEYLGKSIEWRD
jgi:hypothetical protein